jgi:hypothetical protein
MRTGDFNPATCGPVLRVDEDNGWLVLAHHRFRNVGKTCDDDHITTTSQVSSSSIDANLAGAGDAHHGIGLEACPACDVPNTHRFVLLDVSEFHQLGGYGEAPLVMEIRVCYDCAVNLGAQHSAVRFHSVSEAVRDTIN